MYKGLVKSLVSVQMSLVFARDFLYSMSRGDAHMNLTIARNNFKALYLLATVKQRQYGLTWYNEAHSVAQGISQLTGISLVKVAGVISALSPNNSWSRNCVDAQNLCYAFTAGLSKDDVSVCTFNANKNKAWEILKSRDKDVESFFTSNKTLNFFLNILNPKSDFVTVDGHMINAAVFGLTRVNLSAKKKGKDKPRSLNDTVYYELADLIAELSEEFELEYPHQFQAIVWSVYRDLGVNTND